MENGNMDEEERVNTSTRGGAGLREPTVQRAAMQVIFPVLYFQQLGQMNNSFQALRLTYSRRLPTSTKVVKYTHRDETNDENCTK